MLVNSNYSLDILSSDLTGRLQPEDRRDWSIVNNVDYYSTKGNQIVDKNGKAYRIKGINWYDLGKSIDACYSGTFMSILTCIFIICICICIV